MRVTYIGRSGLLNLIIILCILIELMKMKMKIRVNKIKDLPGLMLVAKCDSIIITK
jgi:hypothetical protein